MTRQTSIKNKLINELKTWKIFFTYCLHFRRYLKDIRRSIYFGTCIGGDHNLYSSQDGLSILRNLVGMEYKFCVENLEK